MRTVTAVAFAIAAAFSASAAAAPVLMSADWAKDACDAWNKDPVLTEKLVESGWIKNDSGRSYKVMQVSRSDCAGAPAAEMRISLKEGKASCVYGGAPVTKLEGSSDYAMTADTARWIEMGNGEYGPMKAMMFGRLHFDGPRMEAMSNMGPFESFLLLVGKVDSEKSTCPGK